MANNGFHEAQERKPILYSCSNTSTNSTTTSTNSTPLKLSPQLPTLPQPPLFHVQKQATIFDDDDLYFNSFPQGFRFVPTDEELIVYYLERKLKNLPLPRNLITEVNLYDHHPRELLEQYKHKTQQNYLYFFTPRDKKYKNGSRPNRAAGNGYWKATGADRPVIHNGRVVGVRKSLVYHAGKPKEGEKTNYLMQEFRWGDPRHPSKPTTGTNDMKLDDWVLCRVQHKNNRAAGKNRREEEDFVSNEDENDVEVNEEANNDSMVTPFDYPKPISTSFNPAFNFGYGTYGSDLPSWKFNATQFNNNVVNDDVLYTGSFDDFDPCSFMSFPDSDLPPFPPSDF